jgi:hypothetical protein
MNMDPDLAEARTGTLLAAALHLLSCSALHGATPAKMRALILHLTELADRRDADPLLARSCEQLGEAWSRALAEVEEERAVHVPVSQAGAMFH